MKTLILFSGGDTCGMNTLLWEMLKVLKKHDVYVCIGGLQGLIENRIEKPDIELIKSNKDKGGIVIKSSRSLEFLTEAGFLKAVDNLRKNDIEKTIIVGGDGSYKAAEKLSPYTSILFIPATIDNDFYLSDYSIGFYSAVSNAKQYIENVKQTFASFNRVGIVEVMGRYCSNIAKSIAKQIKPDIVIFNKDDLIDIEKNIISAKSKNNSPLVVIRENIVDVFDLAKQIECNTKLETRACVVGYFQRGGNPCTMEKHFAKMFAKQIEKNINKEDVAIIYKNQKYLAKKILFNK